MISIPSRGQIQEVEVIICYQYPKTQSILVVLRKSKFSTTSKSLSCGQLLHINHRICSYQNSCTNIIYHYSRFLAHAAHYNSLLSYKSTKTQLKPTCSMKDSWMMLLLFIFFLPIYPASAYQMNFLCALQITESITSALLQARLSIDFLNHTYKFQSTLKMCVLVHVCIYSHIHQHMCPTPNPKNSDLFSLVQTLALYHHHHHHHRSPSPSPHHCCYLLTFTTDYKNTVGLRTTALIH